MERREENILLRALGNWRRTIHRSTNTCAHNTSAFHNNAGGDPRTTSSEHWRELYGVCQLAEYLLTREEAEVLQRLGPEARHLGRSTRLERPLL
jgi:hypothetical protein